VGISPNLQLRCSCGQRWADYILRSKGQRSRLQRDQIWSKKHILKVLHSNIMVTYRQPFCRMHTGRQFTVEDHLVSLLLHSVLKIANTQRTKPGCFEAKVKSRSLWSQGQVLSFFLVVRDNTWGPISWFVLMFFSMRSFLYSCSYTDSWRSGDINSGRTHSTVIQAASNTSLSGFSVRSYSYLSHLC